MKLRTSFSWTLFLLIIMMGTSCIPYRKTLYFKNVDEKGEEVKAGGQYVDPAIQRNDILNITLTSIDQDVTKLFSFNADNKKNPNQASSGSNYLVDPSGNITMPFIGALRAEGLTTWQLRDSVISKLKPYLKDPVVEIRISTFRIFVMGDVGRSGEVSVENERITLTEALALAGDLKITARRDNVLLIREENGQRKFIRFNLADKAILDSPYFYLKSNDLIYVQPGSVSTTDANFRIISYISAILGLISLVVAFTR